METIDLPLKGTLKETLDLLSKEGKKIKVTWEGGSDSGGYRAYVDEEELAWNSELQNEIIERVSSCLNYGSWCGDFWVDGYVVYDSEEKIFEGQSKETTTEFITFSSNFKIKVPKNLNFDQIEITVIGSYEDGLDCFVRFLIKDGPVFEEHADYEEDIKKNVISSIQDMAYDAITSHHDGGSIGSLYNNWTINRSEMFEEEEDSLVFLIEDASYGYDSVTITNQSISILEDKDY